MANTPWDDWGLDENSSLEDESDMYGGMAPVEMGGGSREQHRTTDSAWEDDVQEDEEFNVKADTGVEDDTATKKGFKKTALMIVGIALAVFLVGMILIAIISGLKDKDRQTSGSGGRTSIDVSYEISGDNQSTKEQNVPKETKDANELLGNKNISKNEATEQQSKPMQQQTQPQVIEKDPYDWIEVDLKSTGLDFGIDSSGSKKYIKDAMFTITKIDTYARLTGTSNDKQIKGVLTGSISGLPGIYTLEIPADIAIQLQVGQSFTVEYQLQDRGDYMLVGDIKY